MRKLLLIVSLVLSSCTNDIVLDYSNITFEFYYISQDPEMNTKEVIKNSNGILFFPEPLLTNKDIENMIVIEDIISETYEIHFKVSKEKIREIESLIYKEELYKNGIFFINGEYILETSFIGPVIKGEEIHIFVSSRQVVRYFASSLSDKELKKLHIIK